MNNNLFDLNLMLELQKAFVKKDNVNFSEDSVVAAIATAASKIALASQKFDESLIADQVIELYKKSDNENVYSMIGMGPQYVRANIGYSVDFNNYGAVTGEYSANETQYDSIFNKLKYRSNIKESIIK